MTDPWINLRGRAGEQVELIHTPECDTETNPIWEDPQCTCEAYSFNRLLDDADALLTMMEYAGHKRSCELPEQGIRGICNCGFTQALAALPKHLKQEEI